jgi:hypothetical protein
MRNSRLHWLFPALALCAAPALAAVDVSFSDPSRFTDIEASNASDRQQALDDLSHHLVRLGERYLPRGESLAIEVLDVDLAGRVRYTPGARPIRVLNDRGDAPYLKVRYTLSAGGKVVDSREESVTDASYLTFRGYAYSNESLAYEKRMLERWFRERFADKRALR